MCNLAHSSVKKRSKGYQAKIFLTPVWIISNSLLRFQLSWLCRWRQSYRIENWILMPQFRLISPVSSIKVMRAVKTSRKQIFFFKSNFCQLWQGCKAFKASVDAYNCGGLLILQDLMNDRGAKGVAFDPHDFILFASQVREENASIHLPQTSK